MSWLGDKLGDTWDFVEEGVKSAVDKVDDVWDNFVENIEEGDWANVLATVAVAYGAYYLAAEAFAATEGVTGAASATGAGAEGASAVTTGAISEPVAHVGTELAAGGAEAAATVPEAVISATPSASATTMAAPISPSAGTGMLTEAGASGLPSLPYNLPGAATPEMMAADIASREGVSAGLTGYGPMADYAAIQTGGQMLSGYATGQAEEEKLKRQREIEARKSRFGVDRLGGRMDMGGLLTRFKRSRGVQPGRQPAPRRAV